MGICNSHQCTAVVATAKVVMVDGSLLEFFYPVKASIVLEKKDRTFFICNSDHMDFGIVVPPVGADELLLPGNLYFALPVSRMSCRIQGKEMAALAVKASSAMKKSGGAGVNYCGCGGRKRFFEFFAGKHGSKMAVGDLWWRF